MRVTRTWLPHHRLRPVAATAVAVALVTACGAPASPVPGAPATTEVSARQVTTAPAAQPSDRPAGSPAAAGRTRAPRPEASSSAGGPVNVILMVGDGMGIGAREAARLTKTGRTGRLVMDRLERSGWVRTDPADPRHAVTDSAAAATVFATGVRTRNGSVGVRRDGTPVDSLLDVARRRGMATGLVTTSEVTDATPAAFGAHVTDRGRHRKIARQYVRDSAPDVILGGGARRWSPGLLDRAQARGWQLVTDAAGLDAVRGPRVLGLFAEGKLFRAGPEGEYDPAVRLPDLTAAALEVLAADDDGFFLLVEEEGIDEMAHANNAAGTIAATRALDASVAEARRFARENPRTLVVVVGDHETGGMAVERRPPRGERGGTDGPFRIAGTRLDFYVDWTTRSHTGAPTPLSAEGPGARRLARNQHATAVHDVLRDVLTGRG